MTAGEANFSGAKEANVSEKSKQEKGAAFSAGLRF